MAFAEVDVLADLAPDHQRDEAFGGRRGHFAEMHEPPVAQHRDTLGHPREFF